MGGVDVLLTCSCSESSIDRRLERQSSRSMESANRSPSQQTLEGFLDMADLPLVQQRSRKFPLLRPSPAHHLSCDNVRRIHRSPPDTPQTPCPAPGPRFAMKPPRSYRKSYSATDLYGLRNCQSSSCCDWASTLDHKSQRPGAGPNKKKPHKERRFHRLFRNVPLTETLLSRYSCAYLGDMGLLLQGHLYVSSGWICFHSNIFGIEKIIEIPVRSVLTVSKERTAKIIPNAVGLRTTKQKYIFGSLLSRDSTYNLLLNVTGWRRGGDTATRGYQRGISTDDSGAAQVTPPQWPLQMEVEASQTKEDEGDSDTTSSILSEDDDVSCFETGFLAHRAPIALASSVPVDSAAHPCSVSRLSLGALIAYFCSLPKMTATLVFCMILLCLLFVCATFLTIRTLYTRNLEISNYRFEPYASWNVQSLDQINSVLETSLTLIAKIKSHLEILRKSFPS